jgi:cytochrome-b5 reductase
MYHQLTHLQGHGLFSIKGRPDRVVSKIGLIAGGTGITPMLQIIHAVVQENSGIELYLLYAVQREEDILLRQTIEELAVSHFAAISTISITVK